MKTICVVFGVFCVGGVPGQIDGVASPLDNQVSSPQCRDLMPEHSDQLKKQHTAKNCLKPL